VLLCTARVESIPVLYYKGLKKILNQLAIFYFTDNYSVINFVYIKQQHAVPLPLLWDVMHR